MRSALRTRYRGGFPAPIFYGRQIMSKVLFLDIDGVLNSNFWNDSHRTEISDGTLIDEEKIKLLAILVKETGAKIILHSGWRFWFDAECKPLCTEAAKLAALLAKENLYISGVTPDLTTEEIRKSTLSLSLCLQTTWHGQSGQSARFFVLACT